MEQTKLEGQELQIKKMEEVKREANSFLEVYRGNMLYADKPVKVIIDGKEMYKIPVKSESYKHSIFGYVYVDGQTLEVDVDLSTSLISLADVSEEELEKTKEIQMLANNYCESNLDNMHAGVPRRIVVEGEEEFEVIVKGKFDGKTYICGYLFIDAKTLRVEAGIMKKERAHEIAEKLTSYDNSIS